MSIPAVDETRSAARNGSIVRDGSPNRRILSIGFLVKRLGRDLSTCGFGNFQSLKVSFAAKKFQ